MVSVQEAFNCNEFSSMVNLPLSEQAYAEFQMVQVLMLTHNRKEGLKEIWSWKGSDGAYKPKSFYTFMHSSITFNPLLNWVWVSSCTMKIKVFAWMLIMDRLNTKDMLDRRHWNIEDGINCVLCPTHTREDRDHLFFKCNFSVRVWNYLQITWPLGIV